MTTTEPKSNFITDIVEADIAAGKNGGQVVTRFPPEPSGYPTIGHAKAICINFGMIDRFGGRCHLRFDDTNPVKEEQKFIDVIKRDILWLGFDWGEHLYFASDYFEQLYEWATQLINDGLAYVDDQTAEEIRATRGTVTQPGVESPYRARPIAESLDLFIRMRAGEFADGERVVRAKLDMAASNMNMRDPVIYRILHEDHPRTDGDWCIYPMYDFAHGQSDSIEHITHSLCSLEFEDHRPLYDWFCEELGIHHPHQIEFARLKLAYSIDGKRNMLKLVEEGHVSGWDDPRMSTLSGLRRRGYTPAAIRNFCEAIGVTKFNSLTDMALLENAIREDLNTHAPRVMGVLNPLKVVITNYPEGEDEELEAVNNPGDPSAGTREVPFCRELYIEREDFMEDPPRKFFRLGPGREVRLRWAYFITCTDVIKDADGEVIELHCTYDPATRGGDAPDGRKVKGTLHWVSARHAIKSEVRLYDRLFLVANPNKVAEGESFLDHLNPDSLSVISDAQVEPSVRSAQPGDTMQFERQGYFCVDPDTTPDKPVFNRTVTLRDSWAKKQGK